MSTVLSTEKSFNKRLIAKIDLDVFERLIQGGEFSQDDAEGFTDKVLSFSRKNQGGRKFEIHVEQTRSILMVPQLGTMDSIKC